jgi:hypothetical protein
LKLKVNVYLLASGNFVIGKEGKEFIEDVVSINITQNKQGGIEVGLFPFGFPFNQELADQYLTSNNTIWQTEADEQLVTSYLKELSGIDIVSNVQTMDDIRALQGLGIDPRPTTPTKPKGGLRLVKP